MQNSARFPLIRQFLNAREREISTGGAFYRKLAAGYFGKQRLAAPLLFFIECVIVFMWYGIARYWGGHGLSFVSVLLLLAALALLPLFLLWGFGCAVMFSEDADNLYRSERVAFYQSLAEVENGDYGFVLLDKRAGEIAKERDFAKNHFLYELAWRYDAHLRGEPFEKLRC